MRCLCGYTVSDPDHGAAAAAAAVAVQLGVDSPLMWDLTWNFYIGYMKKQHRFSPGPAAAWKTTDSDLAWRILCEKLVLRHGGVLRPADDGDTGQHISE